jgi:hypothetical protein
VINIPDSSLDADADADADHRHRPGGDGAARRRGT